MYIYIYKCLSILRIDDMGQFILGRYISYIYDIIYIAHDMIYDIIIKIKNLKEEN